MIKERLKKLMMRLRELFNCHRQEILSFKGLLVFLLILNLAVTISTRSIALEALDSADDAASVADDAKSAARQAASDAEEAKRDAEEALERAH